MTSSPALLASTLASTLAILLALPTTAAAQSGAAMESDAGEETLDPSYFFDGGAIPFFWGSALVAVGSLALKPPEAPKMFSGSEGGLEARGDTIPEYQIAALAGLSGALLAMPDRPERFYHLKGFAEAVVTTAAITNLAKNAVGRHRPSYTLGSTELDDRRSFFSGHASVTLASTTYLALYLQRNVFSEWRDPDQLMAWWEPLPLASLVALSVYIPYTRVDDNRHHLSDVLIGAGVGASAAAAFYIYQERRFKKRRDKKLERDISLMPSTNGFSIVGRF